MMFLGVKNKLADHQTLKNQHDPAQIQQIETGVQVLQRRRNHVMAMAMMSCTVLIFSAISLYVQQDFIYQWFGVSEQIRQLHVPFAVDGGLKEFLHQPDYVWNLLSWFGWLFLKLVISFMGAFISIALLKKINFFRIRFQSFMLKFVGWLIAFIVLWSGLTYVQYDLRDDEDNQIQQLIEYKNNIQQSQLYDYLQKTEAKPTVQAYLLAQAALMHGKSDRDVALAYNAQLVQAERTDPHFLEYGFKAEQLWAIQHQLYGKSETPIAKSVDAVVTRAQVWSDRAQSILMIITAIFAILTLILYILSQRLAARVQRIGQQIRHS